MVKRAACVALTVSQLTACSWVMVAGPPPTPVRAAAGPPGRGTSTPLPPLHCTRTKFAPILDAVVAGIYIPTGALMVLGGTAVIISEGRDGDGYNRFMGGMLIGVGLVGALLATPFAYSARDGFDDVAACRLAHAQRGE